MFRVRNKETGKVLTVYGFTVMRFLIWNEEEGHWEWPEQDLFEPVADGCDAPYWATEQAYKNGFEAGKREAGGGTEP